MSLLFKLGSLDLSAYVVVEKGSGLDPFDADFAQPQFSQSPLREGGVLVNLDVGLREQSWPLRLNDTTKQELHDLIRDVNRELAKAQSQTVRVEWRDHNATDITYYDVEHGRLEAAFDYHRARYNWMDHLLRVWVQPYGHTATERIVATSAGTGAVMRVAIPSSLAGDTDGLMAIKVTVGSQVRPRGHTLAIAALPHPSYLVEIPAGSLVLDNATLVGASGAQGSQSVAAFAIAQEFGVGERIGRAFLSPASVYEGQNRLLAVAQSKRAGGIELHAEYWHAPIGPTALATAGGGYGLTDLGVFTVSPNNQQATVSLALYGRPRSRAEADSAALFQTFPMPALAPAASAHQLLVNRLVVLPEGRTALYGDRGDQQRAFDAFGGPSAALDRTDDGVAWTSTYVGTGVASPLHRFTDNTNISVAHGGGAGYRGNRLTTGEFRDGLMFSHIAVDSSGTQVAILRKLGEVQANHYTDARVGVHGNGTMYLSLVKVASGVESLLACAMLASSAQITTGRLEYGFANSAATVNWRPRLNKTGGDNGVIVETTVSASDANLALPGEAAVVAYGSHALASARNPQLNDVTVLMSDPTTVLPKAIYRADDTLDEVWRATPSDTFARSLADRQRGELPHPPAPTTVAVAVVALAHPAGPTNDVLSVEVRVRERFTFAR